VSFDGFLLKVWNLRRKLGLLVAMVVRISCEQNVCGMETKICSFYVSDLKILGN